MAVNCCVFPRVMLAFDGVSVMEVSTGAGTLTVSCAEPVFPLREAVIVVWPAATDVARPVAALIVAIAGMEEPHTTEGVMFCVLPSL